MRVRRLPTRVRGAGLFGISVALNGAVSLLSIPIVVAAVGADAWASVATGQSIGTSFGTLTVFGWGLTGPVAVAVARLPDRPRILLESLFARGALFVPLFVAQAIVTFAIVPQEKLAAVVVGAAMSLAGLGAQWYFTGESRPDRFVLLDTVPRVSGTLLGVGGIMLTHDLLVFAVLQLAGSVTALALSTWMPLRGHAVDARSAAAWPTIRARLLEQRHGVLATGMHAAYIPAVLGVIAIGAPGLLPVFVLGDRIAKFVAMAAFPLAQTLQGWVPASTGHELVRRLRVAGGVVLATSVASGLGYVLLLPFFAELLTHGQVRFDALTTIAFGVNTTLTVLSPFLTTIGLMTVGRVRVIALTVAADGAVSLLALLMVVGTGIPALCAWVLVAGSLVSTCWQFAILVSEVKRTAVDEAARPPVAASADAA